ncbi:14247_t:CDS:2 [Funneliformis caledonium]|uniref:14247_t:CDS:1 n=1 Tax=Funneliformis caledonium TaxID=1117310 RepID=A0A9N9CCX1_9GLOM|nr:14247_t:CDS:2 [Funneliformis caledonium]
METLRRETTSTVTRWVLEKRGNTHKTTMLGARVPPDLTGVHRSSSRSLKPQTLLLLQLILMV